VELAPIGISVYTRLDHFQQCINALQNNRLADKSELNIFSDASSKDEDSDLVSEIREYARGITGFKRVNIIERDRNYGGTQNAFQGYFEITKKYKKSIFLEDDIVTAPGFLSFMNEALEFYKNNSKVLSITGYRPPIKIPKNYNKDYFILPRYCGWGSGSFERTIDVCTKQIDKSFVADSNNREKLTVAGSDVLTMIMREVSGDIDAADVRCMSYQALHDVYTVYPRYSLTQNIGHDGTGVHCGETNKFVNDYLWDKINNFHFEDNLILDKRISKENYKFRSISIPRIILNKLKSRFLL